MAHLCSTQSRPEDFAAVQRSKSNQSGLIRQDRTFQNFSLGKTTGTYILIIVLGGTAALW